MGRSNNAARQRNAKGRLNRREKGAPRMLTSIERVRPEAMIIPAGRCLRNPNKPLARFATEEDAAEALRQAKLQRARMGSNYVEKRYYQCPDDERGCGGYHLTSRESYDERTTA